MRNLKLFLENFWNGNTADKTMSKLTIKELNKLIDLELRGERRPTVLTRLHRRLCTQRTKAERANLSRNKLKWRV